MLPELIDLVLPRRCVGCGAAGSGLCAGCVGRGHPLAVNCASVPVYAGASYAGPVRAAILRYKERGRRDLGRPLSVLLARAIGGLLSEHPGGDAVRRVRPVLVSVPSSRSAAAARGGDDVARLARLAGTRAGVPGAPHALRLVRGKQDSAGLDVRARAANLAGVFAAAPAPGGSAAVIVDDIVTTGATLREATRALAQAGWPVLGAAVVAGTPRRRPERASGEASVYNARGTPLAGQPHPV